MSTELVENIIYTVLFKQGLSVPVGGSNAAPNVTAAVNAHSRGRTRRRRKEIGEVPGHDLQRGLP